MIIFSKIKAKQKDIRSQVEMSVAQWPRSVRPHLVLYFSLFQEPNDGSTPDWLKLESVGPDQRWSSWSYAYVFISIQFGCVTDLKSENSGKKLTSGRPETPCRKKGDRSRQAPRLAAAGRVFAVMLLSAARADVSFAKILFQSNSHAQLLAVTLIRICQTKLLT